MTAISSEQFEQILSANYIDPLSIPDDGIRREELVLVSVNHSSYDP